MYGIGFFQNPGQVEIKPDSIYTENGVTVEELRDTEFGHEHANFDYTEGFNGYSYNSNRITYKHPIFILPKENIILAYYQPAVMNINLKWKPNETELKIAKNPYYSGYNYLPNLAYGDQNGKIILIKSDNISNLYKAYFNLFKNSTKIKSVGTNNYLLKKPHPKAFGIGWETWHQFEAQPSWLGFGGNIGINDVVTHLENAKVTVDHFTIGSGYWDYTGEMYEYDNYLRPYTEPLTPP